MRLVRKNQNRTQKPRKMRGFSIMRSCNFWLVAMFYLFINFYEIYGGEILVVHEYVGSSIDLEEKIHFGLFPDYPNFIDAQFFKVVYDKIEVRIKFRSVNGVETAIEDYTPYEFYLLAREIGSQLPLDDTKRRRIQKKHQPLFADRFLAEVPENSICFLKRKDDSDIKGLFYKARGNNIELWSNQQLIAIPRNTVIKMKYWKEYKTYPKVYWCSVIGTAIIGLFSVEILNVFHKQHVGDIWFYRFFAVSGGITIGYKIAPYINDMFIPSIVIEFQ